MPKFVASVTCWARSWGSRIPNESGQRPVSPGFPLTGRNPTASKTAAS